MTNAHIERAVMQFEDRPTMLEWLLIQAALFTGWLLFMERKGKR